MRLGKRPVRLPSLLPLTATTAGVWPGLPGSSDKKQLFICQRALPDRGEAIRQMGAHVFVTDVNYDDTVLFDEGAGTQKTAGSLCRITAWKGYEEVPRMIMQGYLLMVAEALDQMKEAGHAQPTHVFIQAGVGSMPAACLVI